MKEILKKLHRACMDAKGVKKEEKVRGMNFEPLLADKVKDVAMKAFLENNLYPICNYETQIKDNFVMVICNMIIYDIENPSQFIEVKGSSGYGKLDRYGTGNGMTYAQKYAYLAALNLKTGVKDEDGINIENHLPTAKPEVKAETAIDVSAFADEWINKMAMQSKNSVSQKTYEEGMLRLREEYQQELHQISSDLMLQNKIDEAEIKLKNQINERKSNGGL